MACLGGTVEEPKRWIRVLPAGDVELTGRICDRLAPRTSKASCYACPAFRGMDREGNEQTGVDRRGEPIAFSLAEHELWLDDPEKFWQRKEGGGWNWQTIEADEMRAEYMRDYRRRHPEYREREVAAATARVKRQRMIRKDVGKAEKSESPSLGKKKRFPTQRATALFTNQGGSMICVDCGTDQLVSPCADCQLKRRRELDRQAREAMGRTVSGTRAERSAGNKERWSRGERWKPQP